MGNSQKAQQQVQQEIAENLGQFLPQIQVHDTPSDVQVNIPIPPTPCFKEETKIEVIPNEILTKIYEDEDKLKQQKQFQILLEKQDKQIEKAKTNYERRMQKNILKFKQIEARKKLCKQVYEEEYNSIDQNEEKEKEKQYEKEHTDIIWGKKVYTKIPDPMENYFKYRFPKQQNIDTTEEYRNWHIYKQRMYKDQMQEMNDQQEKLKNLEEDLKYKYETLLERKQQRLNSSMTYAALKEKQSKSQAKMRTPSPKKKKKRQKDSLNTSPLSPRKISQNRSQQTTKIDLSQSFEKVTQNNSFQKETQNGGESPSFILNFMGNLQNNNPQHWSPKSPETDFFAKQIFYYQNYSSKRRSSFVYSRDEVERLSMEGNQYPPKRKNYQRPVRCQDNLRDSATFRSKSKSPKKKAKFKEDLTETPQQKIEKILETSVYQKVYEKIPKRQAKMMYSQAEGKLTEVEDFYPYEGSPGQKKSNEATYPQKIMVNDTIGLSPSEDVLEFRIGGKKKTELLGYDFMERVNTNNSVESRAMELTAEEKQVYQKKRSQRDYEARILERLKKKKLS